MRAGPTLLVLALAAAPSTARADTPLREANPGDREDEATRQAKRLYQEGKRQFEAGHYENAVSNFNQAAKLVPWPLLHYNLGVALEHIDEVAAVREYDIYLEMESPELRGRTDAEERAAVLRQKHGLPPRATMVLVKAPPPPPERRPVVERPVYKRPLLWAAAGAVVVVVVLVAIVAVAATPRDFAPPTTTLGAMDFHF